MPARLFSSLEYGVTAQGIAILQARRGNKQGEQETPHKRQSMQAEERPIGSPEQGGTNQ